MKLLNIPWPTLIVIGIILFFIFGGMIPLAVAPWWIWAVILVIIIFVVMRGKR